MGVNANMSVWIWEALHRRHWGVQMRCFGVDRCEASSREATLVQTVASDIERSARESDAQGLGMQPRILPCGADWHGHPF